MNNYRFLLNPVTPDSPSVSIKVDASNELIDAYYRRVTEGHARHEMYRQWTSHVEVVATERRRQDGSGSGPVGKSLRGETVKCQVNI